MANLSVDKQENGENNASTKTYFLAQVESILESQRGLYSFTAAVRGWHDSENDHDLSVRQLTLSSVRRSHRWDLGFQEISWGETFGTYILDIVNPRDFRDPLMDDISWARVPVFALNAKYFAGGTTWQVIATPYPRSNRLPNTGTYFDPFGRNESGLRLTDFMDFKLDRYGAEAEYGGRVSRLFENGIDVALMYFNYWNRNLVFTLDGFGTVTPVQERMETMGFSFSQAFDRLVLRSDTAFHLGQPTQRELFGPVRKENVTQTVLGLDLTSETQWVFGAQWHADIFESEALNWASLRIDKEWLRGKLRSEIFVFHGIGNGDVWIQPRQTWNATDSFRVSLTADFVDANQKTNRTYLNTLSKKDRYLARLEYKF